MIYIWVLEFVSCLVAGVCMCVDCLQLLRLLLIRLPDILILKLLLA